MKKVFHLILSPFILMLFLTSLLTAANGKIAGVVKDSTAKPLKGASVILSGQKQIYLSDADGRYFILNLSPGKYDVVISATGFNRRTVKSVEVRSDLTTELNIVLESATAEAEGIVVDAERNLLNKTMTSSKTIYSADEIEKTFGTSSAFEILQTAPSMYKGFLRGGLQNMTKTLVDGVDISDEYYSVAYDQAAIPLYHCHGVTRYRESQQATITSVNPNSISELSVNTGAIGSDYFSASAGVINYSLKEGKGALTGKVYIRKGSKKLGIAGPDIYNDKKLYFADRDSLIARGYSYQLIYAKMYNWTEDSYENGQIPFEGDLSFSGAINANLGFYFSTNFKNNPDCRLPNQRYKELNSQLKLSYDYSPNIKITALGMLCDKGKLFGWKNSNYQEAWKYYLEGVPQNDGLSWIGSIKLSHFLSTNTFYEVQISNKNSNTRIGYVDGNNDGQLQLNEKGDFITWSDSATLARYAGPYFYGKPFEIYPPGSENRPSLSYLYGAGVNPYYIWSPDIFYENFRNNVFTSKFDYTSQISFHHQLKTGISYIVHDLKMVRTSAYLNLYSQDFYSEKWDVKPIEFGAYLEDKMEYNGLVINLGLRYDLWDPKVSDYKNYHNPCFFTEETNSYYTYKIYKPYRGENIDPFTFFSPSVAVCHPISDKAFLYFSFSKTFQPPPFSMIYSNYNNYTMMAWYGYFNELYVCREPYKTANYEIGVQWEIYDKLTLNIIAYDKKTQNYINSSFRVWTTGTPNNFYDVCFSTGFADSKGMELTLEGLQTQITDFLKISGRFSYTYSHIKIPQILNGLTDNDKYNFSLSDTLTYAKLPFDAVQNYSRIETELLGSSSSLNAGYNREHRILFTLSMLFPYDISIISIGSFQSGFWYLKQYVDPRYAGRVFEQGPWNKQIDVKIEKSFKISRYKLSAFLDIKNLFNSENILAYDNSMTGYELWQTKGDPTGTQKRPIGQDGSLFYDIPREIYFGLSVEF